LLDIYNCRFAQKLEVHLSSKRILILTYYWPPSGGGGVQRWMYFAIYLSKLGFKPTVITVHPDKASYPLIDTTQMEMVKDIETIYTYTFEPLKLYSFLKTGKTKKDIPYGNLGESKGGFFSKAMAFVRANFFVPDARKGWVPYAKKAASKLLKKDKFDWLVTTGPPHSTHLAGLYLSKKFNIKWLADFRDPWGEIYFLQNTFRFAFAQQKDQKLESQILNQANLVTTVGPGMADLLRPKIVNKSKLHVLFNGFDANMLEGIEKQVEKNKKFVISHIGLLGESQRFDVLIEGLKKSAIDVSKVLIHLTGSVHPSHLNILKNSFKDLEFIHQGFLPRKEALTVMKNSNLLLLCPPMIGQTKLIVSTKTMEYLAVSVPILGIGDNQSDAALLVKQQSFSQFYSPENTSDISKFIQECYQNWEKDTPLIDNFNTTTFSRWAITKELVALLNEN
jgi:glycosyltransferase involved in cell wall biosynthesis